MTVNVLAAPLPLQPLAMLYRAHELLAEQAAVFHPPNTRSIRDIHLAHARHGSALWGLPNSSTPDQGRTIDDLIVGETATATQRITPDITDAYGKASDDLNPVHFAPSYAAKTIFERTIAHGLSSDGLVAKMMEQRFTGFFIEGKRASFSAPVHDGDMISIEAEVVDVEHDTGYATLQASVKNQGGKVVTEFPYLRIGESQGDTAKNPYTQLWSAWGELSAGYADLMLSAWGHKREVPVVSYALDQLQEGMSDRAEMHVGSQSLYHLQAAAGLHHPGQEETLATGMPVDLLLSHQLGTRLPGQGAIYLGKEVDYTGQVSFSDTLTSELGVAAVDSSKRIIELASHITNQHKEPVADAKVTLMLDPCQG